LVSPQVLSHWCVVLLHERPAGQSPATLHPHSPLTHAWPAATAVQFKQASPLEPQAADAAPPWQVPPAEQHPPLHGCVAPQVFVQTCAARLQASPTGQSEACWHPQMRLDRHA
jgi:hypothetical protein